MKNLAWIKTANNNVTVILNIGLNVGNLEPNCQLSNTLALLNSPVVFNVSTGEWEGIMERTLVIRMKFDSKEACIRRLVRLCILLKQDAISVYFEDFKTGQIVYNPDYRGVRYTFDSEYFNFSYTGSYISERRAIR